MSVDTSAEDTPLNGDIIVTDACHELGLSLFALLFLGTGVYNVFCTEFIAYRTRSLKNMFSLECFLYIMALSLFPLLFLRTGVQNVFSMECVACRMCSI